MSRRFRPIEDEVSDAFIEAHPPLAWYRLIKRMEEFREITGMGLAGTWALVHAGDYAGALQSFADTREAWHCGNRSVAVEEVGR